MPPSRGGSFLRSSLIAGERVSITARGAMTQYKLYLLKDTHIVAPPTLIEADSDAEAIEQFEKVGRKYDAELWQGQHRQTRL